MTTYSTPIPLPPGRWLAALASSLVLWGIAYAYAPAPAWPLGLPAPGAGLVSYEVAGPTAGRSRLEQLLLSDSDNAIALRQLSAGYAGAQLATASPAGPGRTPSPRMVAANTGPHTRPVVPK